jgi:protoporphyrinogen oxidase
MSGAGVLDRKRVAILGGGPAGLSVAKTLSGVEGLEVDLLEKNSRIGGLQHSVECEGLHFDIGTFLYFHNHGLFNAFPQIQPLFIPIKYTPTSVFPSGKMGPYPFTVRQFIRDNGPLITLLAGLDLVASKVRCDKKKSASEYARYYMGNTIYHRSGLAHYIERLHDVPGHEIDAKFAEERLFFLSKLSFRTMLKNLPRRLMPGGRSRAPAKQWFVRPAKGLVAIYDMIFEDLKSSGVNVELNCQLKSVRRQGDGFIVETDKTKVYDRVISTIPIPKMLELIGDKPADFVETRSLVSLFYRGRIHKDASILCNFSFEASWKRITVFSRFYGEAENGDDYFTVEITSDDLSTENIRRLRTEFEESATKLGICPTTPHFLDSYISPDAYPVFRRGNLQGVEKEKQRLIDYGVDLLGRQGNFEYQLSDWFAKRGTEKGKELAGFFRR